MTVPTHNNGAAPIARVPRRVLNLERPSVMNAHRTANPRSTGGQA